VDGSVQSVLDVSCCSSWKFLVLWMCLEDTTLSCPCRARNNRPVKQQQLWALRDCNRTLSSGCYSVNKLITIVAWCQKYRSEWTWHNRSGSYITLQKNRIWRFMNIFAYTYKKWQVEPQKMKISKKVISTSVVHDSLI